ncbi:MAG: hypothetical protein ACTMHZ_08900, partial [Bifidobacterium psychraerophilum]
RAYVKACFCVQITAERVVAEGLTYSKHKQYQQIGTTCSHNTLCSSQGGFVCITMLQGLTRLFQGGQ